MTEFEPKLTVGECTKDSRESPARLSAALVRSASGFARRAVTLTPLPVSANHRAMSPG
jgi:hypothetical protein